jgi:KaiC/GvpD/RAD55 family RecA-like ATPase
VTEIIATAARDALAVALEQESRIGLAEVRAWRRRGPAPLSAAERDRACTQAIMRAERELRQRYPEADDDAIMGSLDAELARGETFFDDGFANGWDEPDPEFTFVVDGLIADGMIHWASGKHGSLKSTVGAHAALEAIKAGRHVMWLDWEVGRAQARRRFKSAGITEAMAREFIRYRYLPPITDTSSATVERLRTEVAQLDRPLVVIDSMSKALAGTGCDENSNSDVSRFTDAILQRGMKGAGATVYVIDHEGRNQTKSSDYVARGASTKDADADITYRFFVEEEPDRQTVGKLRIICQKDREDALGGLTRQWERSKYSRRGERWFEVGDGRGGLPVVPIEQPSDARRDGEDATFKLAIVDFLRESGEEFSMRALKDELRGARVEFRNDDLGPTVRAMGRDSFYPVSVRTEGQSLRIRYEEATADAAGALSF